MVADIRRSPVDIVDISLITGFDTYQVVSRISSINGIFTNTFIFHYFLSQFDFGSSTFKVVCCSPTFQHMESFQTLRSEAWKSSHCARRPVASVGNDLCGFNHGRCCFRMPKIPQNIHNHHVESNHMWFFVLNSNSLVCGFQTNFDDWYWQMRFQWKSRWQVPFYTSWEWHAIPPESGNQMAACNLSDHLHSTILILFSIASSPWVNPVNLSTSTPPLPENWDWCMENDNTIQTKVHWTKSRPLRGPH